MPTSYPSVETQRILSKGLLLLGAFITVYWILPVAYGWLVSPTKKIPGPFWARVTRWSEFRSVVRNLSHIDYLRLHEKFGSTVRVGPNRYSFSDPADVKVIYELGGQFTKTAYYNTLLHPDPEKRNIFALRDPVVHKNRRRKIASLYSMSTMVNYEGAVDRMTEICMRKLSQFMQERRKVSLPQFMQFYAFDVIGEITFNNSFRMMETESDTTGMIPGIHKANDYLAYVGIVPDLHPWITRWQALMGSSGKVDKLLDFTCEQINKNQEANEKNQPKSSSNSFLTKLLQMRAENQIELPQMLDTCGSNITAGSDTTAISLSAALYHLYKNPDKLATLRKEIDTRAKDALVSDPVTFQESQNMPYLQAVIKETLRVHPAVGTILPRVVPKGGVQLAGTFFPEGAEVGANAWVLHHNKAIYGEDADVYRPERWLSAKTDGDLRDQMMFAFGGGSRACIGRNISLLEMAKVLPQIVRKFDFEFEHDRPAELFCQWFVYMKYNVTVKARVSDEEL